jgi:peroxiredoxin
MSANAEENGMGNEPLPPATGLQVGSKAPLFTLRDQFNRKQSNETLKGSNGTILLFFRSADW